MMKFPRCKNELQQITLEDVTVDICKGGCGGIWSDLFELKKFDEPHEEGEALLDIERDDVLSLDYEHRIKFPKC